MRVTRHSPDKHIQFDYTLHQQRLEQVQSAKYLGLTITDDLDWGQHISEISAKATKTMGFLRTIWPLHLGTLRKLHTKHWFALSSSMQPYHESQIGQVKVQRTAARWTCRRWRNTSSVGDMLDDLEWPSLETRRQQSSLTFFYKIHSGTVSLDKDKYLTPAPNLRRTRASHESQYTRYFAYSDALKNSFFPRTIPMWNRVGSKSHCRAAPAVPCPICCTSYLIFINYVSLKPYVSHIYFTVVNRTKIVFCSKLCFY